MVLFMHEQNIISSETQFYDVAHERTIIIFFIIIILFFLQITAPQNFVGSYLQVTWWAFGQ